MEMIAHQAECDNGDIKTKNADCDIIHTLNKIFTCLEDIIPLKTFAAHVIIAFAHTFVNFISGQRFKQYLDLAPDVKINS